MRFVVQVKCADLTTWWQWTKPWLWRPKHTKRISLIEQTLQKTVWDIFPYWFNFFGTRNHALVYRPLMNSFYLAARPPVKNKRSLPLSHFQLCQIRLYDVYFHQQFRFVHDQPCPKPTLLPPDTPKDQLSPSQNAVTATHWKGKKSTRVSSTQTHTRSGHQK